MSHLSLLKSLGFRRVGAWHHERGGLDFAIEAEVRTTRQSLYAFVAGTQVLYIGKAKGPFAGRMSGYRRPGATQPTNTRINPLITEMARTKKAVSIYHFGSTEEVKFRGILLNVAAALEDTLIERISPKWNVHGRGKSLTRR